MPLLDDLQKDKTLPLSEFSEEYRTKIFTLWFKNSKPVAARLKNLIKEPDPLNGRFLSAGQLKTLINGEFSAKAAFLDEQVAKELERQLVTEKIEMLRDHAVAGRELWEMGMEHLREKGLGNSRTAVTALIEGIKIEKESRGTPIELARIGKMTDEELLGTLQELVSDSEILALEPADAEEE